MTKRLAIVATVVATLAVATGLVIAVGGTDDDSSRRAAGSPTTSGVVTTGPVTTSTAAATTTTTLAAPEVRQPHAWRLGYAGLGPIQLGMTFPDAQLAGQFSIRNSDGGCVLVVEPDSNVGLELVRTPDGQLRSGLSVWPVFPQTDPRTIAEIGVGNPAIYTISGVHVGSTYDEVLRTYPNAVESTLGQDADGRYNLALTITNPEGRAIEFFFSTDRILRFMTLGLTYAVIEGHRKC